MESKTPTARVRIEILADGRYRGRMFYYPPHLPGSTLDVDEVWSFVLKKLPTLRYEKNVQIFID